MEKVAGSVGDAPMSQEAVIRALDNCYDPCCRDRKISVVDMGLIEAIHHPKRLRLPVEAAPIVRDLG